jgi:hypothetical protein
VAPTAEGPPIIDDIVETASQALSSAMESVALDHPVENFPELVTKVLAGLEDISKTSGFSFLKGTLTVSNRNYWSIKNPIGI